MTLIRHRSRHLRGTFFNRTRNRLDALGWITPPINFAADPVVVIDYQPDERGEIITTNTVAVSIGDVVNDQDEELGGQLRSAWYPVFVDVYMATQALTDAMCDDIRAIYDQTIFQLVDQSTATPSTEVLEIEEVLGPDRPSGGAAIDIWHRYWRIMRLGVRMYYQP